MVVHPMTLGMFAVNNYLIHSPRSRKAILIDACEDYQSILNRVKELGLDVVYLINTHGHGDHIAGNGPIIEATGAQLMIHPLDKPYLSDPQLNLSSWMGAELRCPEPDQRQGIRRD